jgi:aspartyl-tRNA(Asn)/glutamyl-tRNA(Gln) amidotransferase subunit A
VGLQVMAPILADDRMYRVAAALESVIPPPTPPPL